MDIPYPTVSKGLTTITTTSRYAPSTITTSGQGGHDTHSSRRHQGHDQDRDQDDRQDPLTPILITFIQRTCWVISSGGRVNKLLEGSAFQRL